MSIVRDVKQPVKSTDGSAGWDFFIPNNHEYMKLKPNESILIPSGIKINIPKNTVFIANNRSSIAKNGLIVGASVVDSDYQGEIHLNLWNVSKKEVFIVPGQKIVQFILTNYISDEFEIVHENDLYDKKTIRGNNGFGSTEI